MSVFLTKIQVNKIFHLENVLIEIDPLGKKHLILTGKNGSGKTSLLNGIADFLQNAKKDQSLNFLEISESLDQWKNTLNARKKSTTNPDQILQAENLVKHFEQQLDLYYGKLNLIFNDIYKFSIELQNQDFILSFYSATRRTDVIVPKNPDKPNLIPVHNIKETKIGEFLKFLVDLKIQEALARNENQIAAADEIKNWFISFTGLLQQIFEGDPLTLEFNYKDYSFTINQNNRRFGFNELSDGYSAIIDIVADLIIKMQDENSLTRAYEKEGIVLIDEVETHLHLKLQRLILPFLTQIFPNIQFIVTTHSPFVLNSLNNAVAYDLEKNMRLDNLTEYSYEALAEGYFRVETDSNFLLTKLNRFKKLVEMPSKDTAEAAEYELLDKEFSSLNDSLTSPEIKGQYLQIKLDAK